MKILQTANQEITKILVLRCLHYVSCDVQIDYCAPINVFVLFRDMYNLLTQVMKN